MGLGYLIALIYTPFMLRLLGKSEYGLYNLVASIVAFLGVLNFGFGSTYMRFYLRYKVQDDKKNIAKLNGLFLLVFTIIGMITIMVSIVMANYSELIFGTELTAQEHETARTLLLILTANLAISFPGIVFSSHITANERFVFQKLLNMLSLIFNPFLSIILLLMGYGSIGLAVATTAVRLLVEIGNIVFCFKKLKMRFAFRRFESGLMRSVVHFSFFIFINLVIDQINWGVDKFILGRYHGTIAVAIYGVAAQINTYYLSISNVISSVFIPRVHKLVAGNQENLLDDLFTRIGRIQFVVLALLSLSLVFFGKVFFELWAGPEYAESHMIALLLVLPVTLPLIQNIGIEIQRAKNLHYFRSVVYFGIALLNTVLTLILARKYQGVGAAFSTAVALLIGNGLIMNIYNSKRVGLNTVYFWKQIGLMLPGLLLPAIAGTLILLFLPITRWLQFLLLWLAFASVYMVSMWFFGLNDYERDLFSRPVRMLLSKLKRK